MAEEKVPQKAPEARETKGFAAKLDVKEDQETIRLLSIAKSVGGVPAKTIVNLGVKAYIQTDDFKKKAEIIKKMGI